LLTHRVKSKRSRTFTIRKYYVTPIGRMSIPRENNQSADRFSSVGTHLPPVVGLITWFLTHQSNHSWCAKSDYSLQCEIISFWRGFSSSTGGGAKSIINIYIQYKLHIWYNSIIPMYYDILYKLAKFVSDPNLISKQLNHWLLLVCNSIMSISIISEIRLSPTLHGDDE